MSTQGPVLSAQVRMGDKNVLHIYPALALSLCHQEGGTDSGSLGEENLVDFLWLRVGVGE